MRKVFAFCFIPFVCATCRKADPPAPTVSFRRDVLPVFEKTCLGAEGCHGNKATDSVHLDLRAPGAYADLVNRPAEARKGSLRVRPGDVRGSFLLAKLSGELGPQEGKRMPLDENTGAPLDPSTVSQQFVDQVLVPWIAAGAADN